MSNPKTRYLERAKAALLSAKVDDFLGFLTVRRAAGGSGTARFYDAFPHGAADGPGGRAGLLSALKQEATPTDIVADAPITNETAQRLMRLVADLKDQKPEALEQLIAIGLDDFDGYFGEENAAMDVLQLLMVAAARTDEDARTRLADYYTALMDTYAGTYGELLMVIGREPIPALGTVENFAAIITALFDGLAVRGRLGDPARELLAASLLPIVAALTVPVGSDPPSLADLLYGPEGPG